MAKKCKLFSISEKQALVAKGVITEDNSVVDSALLAVANAEFAKDFKKIYGKEVDGIGRNKDGRFVVNAKAAKIEEGARAKADAKYVGVDLVNQVSLLPGGGEVYHPSSFSEDLLRNKITGETKGFEVLNADDSVSIMTLGDVMKEFPNSGFTKYAQDVLDSQLDLVAGLSIPHRITMNSYLDVGKAFETKVTSEAQAAGNTRAYMDQVVRDDSNIDENLQGINSLLDETLERTGTEFTVMFERTNDMSIQGMTNGGTVSLNPFSIGANGTNLSYVYMHEKAHVVTMGLLNTDPVYRDRMEQLYGQAQDAGLTKKDHYGMENLLEFISEALTNPTFQQALKNATPVEKSLWERFVEALADAFNRATGIIVENDLLGRVLLANYEAMTGASSDPLNGPLSSSLKILTNMDMNGNYIGEDGDIAELDRAAKKLGLVYKPGKGFFFTNKRGEERRLTRAEIPLHIMGEYAEFTNLLQFGSNDPNAEFETEEVPMQPIIAYNKAVDVHNTFSIGDIDDLHAAQIQIIPPAAASNDTGKYIVGGKEYFRTTESLGFQVTERQETFILENAAAIGNFKDELGKRIFSDDVTDPVDFESINAKVKEEAYDRKNKEENITVEEFNREYRNPVSEEAFGALTKELGRIKGEMMAGEVKKFHSDIVVWNNETRVAGEIDILAENKDGSFTIIDIKTRRKGEDNYKHAIEGQWTTEEKHILQTNTYSNAMQKMGFKMNAPKIIMSNPKYPADQKVVEAEFVEIEGNDFVMVIDLPKVEDSEMYDERGVLTYNMHKNGPDGGPNGLLRRKSGDARGKYRFWREGQRVKEGMSVAGPELNFEETSEQLRANITKVQNTLQQYTNFVKKNPSYGTLSVELADVLKQIKDSTGEDVDDLVLEEAILIANNFFKYAAIQLQELQSELKNSMGDTEDRKSTYLRIKNYKGVFGVAQELFETIEQLSYTIGKDNVELENARAEFKVFEGISTTLQTDLNIALKDLYRAVIAETYLGSKGEIKMMQTLQKEAEALHGNDKEKIQAYINEKRSEDDYSTKVKEASRDEVNKLINAPVNDMTMAAFMFNSDISINNDFVQLFHNMLLNAEQRFSTVANEEVLQLSKIADEVNLTDDEIKQLIVVDAEGDSFLMSDYKIEFADKVNEWKKKMRTARDASKEEGLTEKEIAKLNLAYEKVQDQFRDWYNANTVKGAVRTPTAEWATDYSVLNDRQMKALNTFKAISKKNQGRISGQSLIVTNNQLGTYYYRLPGVLKTTFGHAFDGNLVGVAKKYWQEATKIEMGDVEEGQTAVEKGDQLDAEGEVIEEQVRKVPTGLDGKPIFTVPIFFRGRPKENQNQDLFTIYALELQNGIRYEVDSDVVTDATIFSDMVNDAEFIQTAGMNKEKLVSLWKGEGSVAPATLKGDASVVSKQIQKMMKNRVFAMTQEYGGTVYGKDVNRIMATIGSYTAFASMSFKVLGSANNWVTGNVSAALEAVGGEFYTKKDIAAAKALYYNEIGGIVGDIGAPVKKGKINQLIAIFDVQGDRDILNNNFERKNAFTRNFQPGTTLAGYSMGEHEIHATIMLSILHSNKVLNKKGQWLNKAGKVVTKRSEAASLVDAYVKEKDGIVRLQKWAEYSEFDTVNKLSANGQATIRGLIKDRVVRTQGAFDKHMQSELNRRWYGKLFFQFKKHMPPQLLNRFRGAAHFRKSTADLTDDKKYYNLNAKTEEYGYYTTFFRFINNVLKAEKYNIAGWMEAGKNEWKSNMTKHEKANMRKVLTESQYILWTYILAMMAVSAVDDDDEVMWGLIYLLRRQTMEGGLQYVDPSENWRVLESPMAAMSKVNSMIDAFTQILRAGETYDTGIHRGENKLKVRASRVLLLDRLDQFEKGYNKRMYNHLAKE